MVKVAWFLSICVLFVVLVLQFSDALQCYSYEKKGNVECPSTSSCVMYTCRKDPGDGKLKREGGGSGCVEDFFNDAECTTPEAAVARDFIKKQTFLDLHYYNGYVEYVSGCRTESDKYKCIYKKHDKLFAEVHPNDHDPKEPKEQIVEKWYSTAEDSTAGGGSDASGPNGNQTSSSNQNGAFKFIGIIAFGWILFASA